MNARFGVAAAAMLATALGLGGCVAASTDEIAPSPLAGCLDCAPGPVEDPYVDYSWYGGFWPYGYAHVGWPHYAYHGGWRGRVHASHGFRGHHHG